MVFEPAILDAIGDEAIPDSGLTAALKLACRYGYEQGYQDGWDQREQQGPPAVGREKVLMRHNRVLLANMGRLIRCNRYLFKLLGRQRRGSCRSEMTIAQARRLFARESNRQYNSTVRGHKKK